MRTPILAQRSRVGAGMLLSRPDADVFVPGGRSFTGAAKRSALLGIAAHPDDLECMSLAPIARGIRTPASGFAGVVVTTGAGCPRAGVYSQMKDGAMARLRRDEQRKAAVLGRYALLVQLGHPAAAARESRPGSVDDDLEVVLRRLRPREVFTHDLADRHPTHVGVALKVVAAARRLPRDLRPARLVGCEVWRSLDWLCTSARVGMPFNGAAGLGKALLGVFKSQIASRRYDLGVPGRLRANSVFSDEPAPRGQGLALGMDLTPLLLDDALSPRSLMERYLKAFRLDVLGRMDKLVGVIPGGNP